MSKFFTIPVYAEVRYISTIEVPDSIKTKEEAFAYAEGKLPDFPLTEMEYIPDSDNIDREDLDSPHCTLFGNTADMIRNPNGTSTSFRRGDDVFIGLKLDGVCFNQKYKTIRAIVTGVSDDQTEADIAAELEGMPGSLAKLRLPTNVLFHSTLELEAFAPKS